MNNKIAGESDYNDKSVVLLLAIQSFPQIEAKRLTIYLKTVPLSWMCVYCKGL